MANPNLVQALQALNDTLRAGQITDIAARSENLRHCLEEAENQITGSLPELKTLRAMAVENQVLLDAVGRGLRQAANRLTEIAEARQGLRTYGPGGGARAWIDRTGQGSRF